MLESIIIPPPYPHTSGWEFTGNGIIGEKMSYKAPKSYWDALHYADITQIIDLRYKYNNEKFLEQCQKYGFRYYSYPIHNDPDTIANMVRNFYHFTELLTDGGYYMMGRSHGFTAFIIYLSFFNPPATYPMELCHYLKNNKNIMDKAVPIMRAMARQWGTEYNLDWGDGESIVNKLNNDIDKFTQQKYPEKLSLSFVDFTRQYRNGDVVYDISVKGIGRVGYLFPKNFSDWGYDIVMYPYIRPISGTKHYFEQAQYEIISHLCSELPHSAKFVALPPAMKMTILLMKEQLNC